MVKETSRTSVEANAVCTCRICELMRGHGPGQLVNMKSATQTWPFKTDSLSKAAPVLIRQENPGTEA